MGASHRRRPATAVFLHFLELQIPMVLGATVCLVLGSLVPSAAKIAASYYPGTHLFAIGDVLFLTVPVAGWMAFRGHPWRHSLEMVLAMVLPVAAIAVVGEVTGPSYLLWLVTAMYPAMCLGMLLELIYRRDDFSSGGAHASGSILPAEIGGPRPG